MGFGGVKSGKRNRTRGKRVRSQDSTNVTKTDYDWYRFRDYTGNSPSALFRIVAAKRSRERLRFGTSLVNITKKKLQQAHRSDDGTRRNGTKTDRQTMTRRNGGTAEHRADARTLASPCDLTPGYSVVFAIPSTIPRLGTGFERSLAERTNGQAK